MTKRKTYEEVKNFLEDLGWELLEEKYINSNTKMKCLCPNKHINYKRFDSFVSGDGCKFCRDDGNKYTLEKVKEIISRDGNVLLSDYIDSSTHMKVLCPKNHEYNISLNKFNSGRRCPTCFAERISEISRNAFVDIAGKKFGKLTAIKRIPYDDGVSWWECSCDCNNICIIRYSSLVAGYTKSCGCLGGNSFISIEVKRYLKKEYNAEDEYRIFKNPKTGYWLPYDIYIPYGENPEVNGFYIEVHGIQHYKISGWHIQQANAEDTTPEEEFEYQKYKDEIKKKFAKKHGRYIEIDLRKIKTTEEAIEYIEKIIKKTLS